MLCSFSLLGIFCWDDFYTRIFPLHIFCCYVLHRQNTNARPIAVLVCVCESIFVGFFTVMLFAFVMLLLLSNCWLQGRRYGGGALGTIFALKYLKKEANYAKTGKNLQSAPPLWAKVNIRTPPLEWVVSTCLTGLAIRTFVVRDLSINFVLQAFE